MAEMKMIQELHKFWFSTKLGFPNGMNILLGILILNAFVNLFRFQYNIGWIQIISILSLSFFLCIFAIFTIGLIIIKSYQNKRI